jgi:hypothetical protein
VGGGIENIVGGEVEIASQAQFDDALKTLAQLGQAGLDDLCMVWVLIAGVRRADNVSHAFFGCPVGHGNRSFQIRRAVVHAVDEMVMDIDQWNCLFLLGPGRRYIVASASTIEAKIFQPSADPRITSLERSGCGIMPRTFLFSLRMPAILPREPLGLASGVMSPAAVQ